MLLAASRSQRGVLGRQGPRAEGRHAWAVTCGRCAAARGRGQKALVHGGRPCGWHDAAADKARRVAKVCTAAASRTQQQRPLEPPNLSSKAKANLSTRQASVRSAMQ